MLQECKRRLKKRKRNADDTPVYEIPLKDVNGEPLNLWSAIFKRELFRLRKSRKIGWEFDKYVRTDGVSLCSNFRSLYQQACSRKASHKKNACGCSQCSADSIPLEKPKHMLAVDPGCINIFYCVRKRDDGSFEVFKYRNVEYYDEGGISRLVRLLKSIYDAVRKRLMRSVLRDARLSTLRIIWLIGFRV